MAIEPRFGFLFFVGRPFQPHFHAQVSFSWNCSVSLWDTFLWPLSLTLMPIHFVAKGPSASFPWLIHWNLYSKSIEWQLLGLIRYFCTWLLGTFLMTGLVAKGDLASLSHPIYLFIYA